MSAPFKKWTMTKGILLLTVLAIFCFIPASAITLAGGSSYVGSIAPGSTDTVKMTIGLSGDDNPSDVSIDVMGFGQSANAGFVPVDPEKDINPYSARKFISLDNSTLHLKPGTSQPVTATITVPTNAGSGGRYAIIYIHTSSEGGTGQTAIATGIIIPVLITISGTNPIVTGSITGVEVGELAAGQPVVVTTTFKNTGNYHYRYIVNNVTVSDSNNNIIASGSAQPWQNSIIPGNTVQYVVKPETKNITAGTYTVNSKISLPDGKVLDEKSTTFTVKSNYVPPVTESSITLTPGNAGTLTSPDSRYSISFPQGAVLGDALVTLKAYSRDKLPSAPSGAKIGATSFEITGLSGLLSKDATVRVKYSADDLAAAGGDVSKLKLSYYDAANSAWVILPTTVDPQAMTLTTTTNHLSVWAVMVSSSTTTKTGTDTTSAGTATAGTTAAKETPLSATMILASLTLAILAAGYQTRKRK